MTARRGRSPGFLMSDTHRVKIENAKILNGLIDHFQGTRNLSLSQVNVGLALLKKVLPDLQAVEISGANGGPVEINDVSARETLLGRLTSIAHRQLTDNETDQKLN